jgi:hypothetical protein
MARNDEKREREKSHIDGDQKEIVDSPHLLAALLLNGENKVV